MKNLADLADMCPTMFITYFSFPFPINFLLSHSPPTPFPVPFSYPFPSSFLRPFYWFYFCRFYPLSSPLPILYCNLAHTILCTADSRIWYMRPNWVGWGPCLDTICYSGHFLLLSQRGNCFSSVSLLQLPRLRFLLIRNNIAVRQS